MSPAAGSFLFLVTEVSGTRRAWGIGVMTYLLASQLVLSIARGWVGGMLVVSELFL